MTTEKFVGTIAKVNMFRHGIFMAQIRLDNPIDGQDFVIINSRTTGYYDLVRQDRLTVGVRVSGIVYVIALLALEVKPII